MLHFAAIVEVSIYKKIELTRVMWNIWGCVEEAVNPVTAIAPDDRKSVALCVFLNNSSHVSVPHAGFHYKVNAT